MNRIEKIVVAILALALLGSFYIMNRDQKRMEAYRKAHPVAVQEQAPADAVAIAGDVQAAFTPAGTNDVQAAVAASTMPEQTFTLSNSVAMVTLTTKGGGIKSATLTEYNETLDPADGFVELDFRASPSMSLEGIPGLGAADDFAVAVAEDAKSATITATAASGLKFERRVVFTNGYNIAVADTLRNETGAAVTVPRHKVALGPMQLLDGNSTIDDLAVDVKAQEDRKVDVVAINSKTKNIGFSSLFHATGGGCSASKVPQTAPVSVSSERAADVFWISARERFFVQVLTPEHPSVGMEVRAVRDAAAPGGALKLKNVSSALVNAEQIVEPGAQASSSYSLFVGPRKLSELRKLGPDHTKIMQFGLWAFFCRLLLDVLNFLYGILPNYGIAIILLTGIVRLILYPINKRNAEGMRKIQEIQPLLKEVQAKYKDDPKKLQAETMRIYGENKVNPLASCLPMLIQLPVFIALFTVLRSAVELRYAPFLWITDLSAPENLFRDVFGFGINILPILMALTMALQSYLTPTAGDPSQQKMMMVMMPIMMLAICYNFASALSLYWTVSQVLAIFGLLRTRAKRKRDASGPGKGVGDAEVQRETRQMRRERERRHNA